MALNNSQYDNIMREYSRTRDYNRFLLESRKEHIYQTIPEYWDLEESISSLSIAAVRKMMDGDTNARDLLHASLSKVKEQQKQMLVSAGYTADYLDSIYKCKACKDTGYITEDNGTQSKCMCFRKREISILYAQSNIQEMLETENFSSLSSDYYQGEDLKRFETTVNLCKNFVQNFEQDYQNIFFYGTVGTGKSFLSGCIAKELLNNGHSVIYFSAAALFETFARYSFDNREKGNLQDFCDDIYGCDLLIIDDLGTEVTNSFVTSQLFTCLNERNLRKKPMIISTNLSLEELRDRYSDRTFSRISSSFKLCKITGPDIRILKKRQAIARVN